MSRTIITVIYIRFFSLSNDTIDYENFNTHGSAIEKEKIHQ